MHLEKDMATRDLIWDFTHLILDSMWATSQTLFWPFHGWSFPAANHKIGLGQISAW